MYLDQGRKDKWILTDGMRSGEDPRIVGEGEEEVRLAKSVAPGTAHEKWEGCEAIEAQRRHQRTVCSPRRPWIPTQKGWRFPHK